jgi:hypothetical protein
VGAAALAFTAVPLVASSAGAAPTVSMQGGAQTGTPAGYGDGYNDVIGSTSVYNTLMDINGNKVFVYCLLQPLAYVAHGTYTATTTPSASIKNVELADDIAANSSKIGVPLTIANEEAVAVQVAIWNETSGFNIYQVQNLDITNRVNALIGGATPLAPTTSGAILRVTHTTSGNDTVVRVALTSSNGAPLADQGVAVTSSKRHEYTTNADGVVSLKVPNGHNVSVTWVGSLPAGTVMTVPTKNSQPLVTAGAATISRTVSFATAPRARPVTTTTVVRVAPSSPVQPVTTTTVRPVTTTTVKRATPTTTTTAPPPTTTVARTTTTTAPAAAHDLSSSSHFKSWWWLIILAFLVLIFVIGRRMFERS